MDTARVIRIACWRFGHADDGTFNKTAADYLVGITATPPLPTTLLEFYKAVIAHGGAAVEIAPFYKHSALVADMKTALGAGNTANISTLVEIGAALAGQLSDATLSAVSAVLNTQSLVEVVSAEQFPGEDAPTGITEADVVAALA